MKNILIPTDFSKNAWNAIRYAMEFFKEQRCTFYFLHTYTPSFYRMDYVLGGPTFSAIPDKGLDISQAGLERTIEKVQTRYGNPGHTYEMVSAFNILTDEVNELTASKDIDIVVMGTQGATGAKEIFLGSNTVYVLRKARVPVLVIPQQYEYTAVMEVLFPTDYAERYHEEELALLIEMVKLHGASLQVLHVMDQDQLTDQQKKNKKYLDQSLAQITHSMTEIGNASIPDAVVEYADRNEINLIAMMKRKHSFLERLLIRQNTDQIGFHVKLPLLVMQASEKK